MIVRLINLQKKKYPKYREKLKCTNTKLQVGVGGWECIGGGIELLLFLLLEYLTPETFSIHSTRTAQLRSLIIVYMIYSIQHG